MGEPVLETFEQIQFSFLGLTALNPLSKIVTIGIDPGQVNMGLAVMYGTHALLCEAKLLSVIDPIENIMQAAHAVQYMLKSYKGQVLGGCVEGAAYMATSGQVPLGENRVTAAITLMQAGIWPVMIKPPATIREQVFGHGRIRAQEVWPHLPENAASAFGCALYVHAILQGER